MQRKLLTNGNINKLTNGRWAGSIWYMDEHGERKRKGFTGKTKQAANGKITDFIANFNNEFADSQEANWIYLFLFLINVQTPQPMPHTKIKPNDKSAKKR